MRNATTKARQRPIVPFDRHAAGGIRIDAQMPAAARRPPEPLLPRRMSILAIRRSTVINKEPNRSHMSRLEKKVKQFER
jgi:hypothetical protein